jgi:hypothetical protein
MARRSLALLQQQQHCRYHHPFIGCCQSNANCSPLGRACPSHTLVQVMRYGLAGFLGLGIQAPYPHRLNFQSGVFALTVPPGANGEKLTFRPEPLPARGRKMFRQKIKLSSATIVDQNRGQPFLIIRNLRQDNECEFANLFAILVRN